MPLGYTCRARVLLPAVPAHKDAKYVTQLLTVLHALMVGIWIVVLPSCATGVCPHVAYALLHLHVCSARSSIT